MAVLYVFCRVRMMTIVVLVKNVVGVGVIRERHVVRMSGMVIVVEKRSRLDVREVVIYHLSKKMLRQVQGLQG